MRSFNWKMAGAVCGFIILALGINSVLNVALCPDTYTRADISSLEEGDFQDLIVGSSHGKCGIDPEVLFEKTGRRSTNQCLGGEYPVDALYLVKEACRKHVPERVIYELDPGYFTTEPNEGPDFSILYREFPASKVKAEYFCAKMLDGDFRSTLFPWYLWRKNLFSIGESLKEKTTESYKTCDPSRYATEAQTYHANGFIERKEVPWEETEPEAPFLWNEDTFSEDAEKDFQKLAACCKEKGIELIAVMTPVPEETETRFAEEYEKAYTYFEELTGELSIPFWNFNEASYGFERSISGYADSEGHMYGKTAKAFSQMLGECLAGQ